MSSLRCDIRVEIFYEKSEKKFVDSNNCCIFVSETKHKSFLFIIAMSSLRCDIRVKIFFYEKSEKKFVDSNNCCIFVSETKNTNDYEAH